MYIKLISNLVSEFIVTFPHHFLTQSMELEVSMFHSNCGTSSVVRPCEVYWTPRLYFYDNQFQNVIRCCCMNPAFYLQSDTLQCAIFRRNELGQKNDGGEFVYPRGHCDCYCNEQRAKEGSGCLPQLILSILKQRARR